MVDYEQLRVQRRAEVSPSRVQSIAVNRLKMRTPDPSITALREPAKRGARSEATQHRLQCEPLARIAHAGLA